MRRARERHDEVCDDDETKKELAAIDEVLKGIAEEDCYLNPPRELRPVELRMPEDYVRPHSQFIEPQQLQTELLAKVCPNVIQSAQQSAAG